MDGGMWAFVRSRNGWVWDREAGDVEAIRVEDILVAEGDIRVEVTRAAEEDTREGAADIRAEGDRVDSVPTKIDLYQRMTLSS